MKFTKKQVLFLEDKILNMLTPMWNYIYLYEGKIMPPEKIEILFDRMTKIKEFLHSLRKD